MSQSRRRKIASHGYSCRTNWYRISILIPTRSPCSTVAIHARPTTHRHSRRIFTVRWAIRSPSTTSTSTPYARVSCRIQRLPVIGQGRRSRLLSTITTPRILPLHLERSELRQARLLRIDRGAPAHWRRAIRAWQLVRHQPGPVDVAKVLIVIGTAHVCVLRDPLLTRFSAHQRPSHSAGYN